MPAQKENANILTMKTTRGALGSKDDPVRLYRFEIDELRDMLWRAERDYDAASTSAAKAVVREDARKRILTRWPMLFDYAHIALRSDPDCRAYWANEFIKRAFKLDTAFDRALAKEGCYCRESLARVETFV